MICPTCGYVLSQRSWKTPFFVGYKLTNRQGVKIQNSSSWDRSEGFWIDIFTSALTLGTNPMLATLASQPSLGEVCPSVPFSSFLSL